jgi:hypothetical protein
MAQGFGHNNHNGRTDFISEDKKVKVFTINGIYHLVKIR